MLRGPWHIYEPFSNYSVPGPMLPMDNHSVYQALNLDSSYKVLKKGVVTDSHSPCRWF